MQGQVGYYDIKEVSAASPEELLDKLVHAAESILNNSKTNLGEAFKEEAERNIYITTKFYDLSKKEIMGFGSLTRLRYIIQTVAGTRQNAMWSYQSSLRLTDGPNGQSIYAEQNKRRRDYTLMNISDHDLTTDPRYSAVIWSKEIELAKIFAKNKRHPQR